MSSLFLRLYSKDPRLILRTPQHYVRTTNDKGSIIKSVSSYLKAFTKSKSAFRIWLSIFCASQEYKSDNLGACLFLFNSNSYLITYSIIFVIVYPLDGTDANLQSSLSILSHNFNFSIPRTGVNESVPKTFLLEQ